jgi:hypothetical protein
LQTIERGQEDNINNAMKNNLLELLDYLYKPMILSNHDRGKQLRHEVTW